MNEEKKVFNPKKAIIIVCDDGEGVYTWLAESLDKAREHVRNNLAEIYQLEDADVEALECNSYKWVDYGEAKYMFGPCDMV